MASIFSGTGREDVKFHVLKDFEERLSDRIAARVDNIKPLHTTRMGPAIRHTIQKLRAQESRTKLLMLISIMGSSMERAQKLNTRSMIRGGAERGA